MRVMVVFLILTLEKIMKARYIRVSTTGQNTARQEAKQHSEEKAFIDRISGAIPFNERPAAKEIINAIQAKEISSVSVSSIDRLGRNMLDILQTIQYFTDNGINLHIDNLGLDSLTKEGKPNQVFGLITSVMASVSQMERETLRERQEEGIKAAKARGEYKGRVAGTFETDEEVLTKYKRLVRIIKQHPELSLRKLAGVHNEGLEKKDKVSPNTVKKIILTIEKQKG